MKPVLGLSILCLLTALFAARCHHPTPSAASVEVRTGAVPEGRGALLADLVAAFDRAEAAVQRADLDAVMEFYAKSYNYHGLKRADVRRVWGEVFTHYGHIHSTHVFTNLTVTKSGNGQKASVTCTGGLYGTDHRSGKPITIDSWVGETHFLVHEQGRWRFLGNAGDSLPPAPAASAPHHPLF